MSFNVKKYVAAYITIALVAFGLGAWVDMPVLAQQPVCPAVVPVCGGGSGGGITAGTTAITGGTDTSVIFNDGGVWGEDAGLTYNKTTDVLGTSGTTAYVGKDGTAASPTYRGTTSNSGVYFTGAIPTVVQSGTNVFYFGSTRNQSALDLAGAADNFYNLGVSGAAWKDIYYKGWRIGGVEELALNADYTNATTTFSNTVLSVSLTSGQTYSFTVNLLMSDSVAADGMKIDFNGGAATITNFRVSCEANNDTTGATVAFTAATSTTLAGVINIPTMASTGTHMVVCNGTIVPSSTNTFILRAAQNAHTTGTLTITRGSWMSIRNARAL